jgi:hypothetical protein
MSQTFGQGSDPSFTRLAVRRTQRDVGRLVRLKAGPISFVAQGDLRVARPGRRLGVMKV